jgi:hypothetical protein
MNVFTKKVIKLKQHQPLKKNQYHTCCLHSIFQIVTGQGGEAKMERKESTLFNAS